MHYIIALIIVVAIVLALVFWPKQKKDHTIEEYEEDKRTTAIKSLTALYRFTTSPDGKLVYIESYKDGEWNDLGYEYDSIEVAKHSILKALKRIYKAWKTEELEGKRVLLVNGKPECETGKESYSLHTEYGTGTYQFKVDVPEARYTRINEELASAILKKHYPLLHEDLVEGKVTWGNYYRSVQQAGVSVNIGPVMDQYIIK